MVGDVMLNQFCANIHCQITGYAGHTPLAVNMVGMHTTTVNEVNGSWLL